MRKISRDVLIAIIFSVAGIVVGGYMGYLISDHFYELNFEQSKKDVRKELLDGASIDLVHNTLKENFPQLHDSARYVNSVVVWRKLVNSGLDRLYFNILIFRDYSEFEEFTNLVNEVKLVTDDFNDRITLRNNSILLGRGLVTFQNPLAYHYYQTVVRPKVLNLLNYLKLNYNELIQ